MAETFDPEEVAMAMNLVKDVAIRVIETHGGMVNQFVGDEIMALFGVPVANDDDPVRAVRAALVLHERVLELAATFTSRVGRAAALHTGVNTGLVVVQQRDRRDGMFGVTGDAVNTCARLAARAGADEILIGPATHRAVAARFRTEPAGRLELRGKAAPVEAHRVLGAAHGPPPALAGHTLTPLSGRERELSRLRAGFGEVAAGRGSVFTVAGEAGVGKSRLFQELADSAGRAGVELVQAGCDASGTAAPYAPLVQVVRSLLSLESGGTPTEQASEVADRCRKLGLEAPVLAPILQLMSLPQAGGEPPARGEEAREVILDALETLVGRRAEDARLAFLLEDWHAADEASELALRRLLRVPGAMWVVNFRSHFTPDWDVGRVSIELPPLAPSEARAMVDALCADKELPPDRRRSIVEQTGGNPFFIEEVCRDLIDVSGGRPGGDAGFATPIPESVEIVVRARIDRLTGEQIRVLRVASVLGVQFEGLILARMVPDASLAPVLRELERAGLVLPIEGRDGSHRFKHAITRSVAYESLLRRDRRALHDEAGRIIEEVYSGDHLEIRYDELAHHFSNGTSAAKAVLYLEAAGNKAAGSFSLAAAREHFGAAVRLLATMPDTPEWRQKRVDLIFRCAQAGWYGPTTEQIEALREAQSLSAALRDRGREIRSIYFQGWLAHTKGMGAAAVEHFERCIREADPLDYRLLSQLYCNLGENLALGGSYERALEVLERGLAMRRRSFPDRWRTIGMAYAISWVGLIHADRGDFDTFEVSLEEALGIIGAPAHSSALSSINQVRTIGYAMKGDWMACRECAELGLRVANAIGAPTNHGMARILLGWSHFMSEGDEAAIGELESGLEEMKSTGTQLADSLYHSQLAEALLRCGDVRRGVEVARRAIRRGEDGDRLGEVPAHRVLAMAHAAEGDETGMREELATAARLAERRGSRRDEALNRLVEAELAAGSGDEARAAGLARSAESALAAMGMDGYGARAHALAAASPPSSAPGLAPSSAPGLAPSSDGGT